MGVMGARGKRAGQGSQVGSAWWRGLAAGLAGTLLLLLTPVAFAHHQHYVSCRPIPGVCPSPTPAPACPGTDEFHCVLAPGACPSCVVASVAEAGARADCGGGENCEWCSHDDIVVTCVPLPTDPLLASTTPLRWGSAGGPACKNGYTGDGDNIYVRCNSFWDVMTGVGHRNDGGCETDAWIPFCAGLPNNWIFDQPSGTPTAVGVHGIDGGSTYDQAEVITRRLTPPPSPVTCSAAPSSVGLGETVTLTGTSQSQGTFTWNTGGGNPATGTGPTLDVTYATAGQKTISVTLGAQTGTCSVQVLDGEPWCSIEMVGPQPTTFGMPFTVAWSNAPNLRRITSLGWQTVDELGVPATGILVPQPGFSNLPACPPQAPTTCQWSPLTFMAEGTASVTVEVENQSGVVRTCDFSYTFDCGPTSGHPLDPVTKAIEDAIDALNAFKPNFVNVIQPVSITDPIYSWHDNRGWHHVKVEVKDGNVNTPGHPFIYIPRMKAKSSFFKKCVIVKYAQQTVRVIVTRYDQDNAASRHWAMKFRTNAGDQTFVEHPSDPAFSIQFGIKSTSKVRHGYKPNSVWIVEDNVTK